MFGAFVLFGLYDTPTTVEVSQPQPAAVVQAATTPPLEAAAPIRLIIPIIGVDAKVEPLGISTTAQNELAVPENVVNVG